NCSWGPKRILGDGKVKGVELVKCTRVFDEEGLFNPTFDESVSTFIKTDMVIIAIGQVSDLTFLEKDIAPKITKAGTLQVSEATLETSVPGIFAAGDVVSIASVVEAIAVGRKVASSIDRYLGGDGIIDMVLVEKEVPNPWLGKEKGFGERARIQAPKIPLDKRKLSFAEIELGFDRQLAVKEASRCLQCDLRLQISKPVLPPEKWLEFNLEKISRVLELEGVYQLLDERKIIIYIKGTPNLRKELEEELKTNVKARYFSYEEEPMYTKRETELLQQFLQQHGKLPELNEELEELF
ncbi:MAG: FAD-dependent oxidoreductase, partial [Candidatus Thermoplasmatota archaeon]